MTVEDPRRMADRCRGLRDRALMAKAWDEPVTRDVRLVAPLRTFGQRPSLAVPDTFDDPLPDPEIVAWEGDSPS
jgi:hypothetical protein